MRAPSLEGEGRCIDFSGRMKVKRLICVALFFFALVSAVHGKEDPLEKLKENALSYFKTLSGTVTGVEGDKVILSIGEKDSVRPGMRLKVLREGVPFVHPVTGEVVGKVEAAVGRIEIRDARPESSSGVLIEGGAKQGDGVRLSDTMIKMMFSQEKNVGDGPRPDAGHRDGNRRCGEGPCGSQETGSRGGASPFLEGIERRDGTAGAAVLGFRRIEIRRC
jgi:hypothetical protein